MGYPYTRAFQLFIQAGNGGVQGAQIASCLYGPDGAEQFFLRHGLIEIADQRQQQEEFLLAQQQVGIAGISRQQGRERCDAVALFSSDGRAFNWCDTIAPICGYVR